VRFMVRSASLKMAMMVGVALLVGGMLSLFLNVRLYYFYKTNKQMSQVQQSQHLVIDRLEREMDALRSMIEELMLKEEKIRQDLGHPKTRPLSQRRSLKKKQQQFNAAYPSSRFAAYSTHQLTNELSYLKQHALVIEQRMRNHMGVIKQYNNWFDETPSIWPIYGYVRSGFGWRNHPLRRSRQFHKGIDIPAWMGAPVQATADGYVEFAGWGGGYGWIVVLSHKFGYKTIYAHLSEIGVNSGRKVFKGQIIGKVGSSGLSTGPHVHYEIRQRQKALEPAPYLDLDLFTAISKLW
jgi:murein DD-endopeptidase MepM/ murein hydrolase activator NlpD